MVVYHRANTGSHELQKPPKATYVTPYPQKNKYSFLGILSLRLLALFGLLGFFRAQTQCHVPRKPCGTTHPAQANGGSMSGKDM